MLDVMALSGRRWQRLHWLWNHVKYPYAGVNAIVHAAVVTVICVIVEAAAVLAVVVRVTFTNDVVFPLCPVAVVVALV